MPYPNKLDITIEQVTASLEKIVELKGEDFVYTPPTHFGDPSKQCKYVHEVGASRETHTECGCIWGHVFVDLGLSLDLLQRHENESAINIFNTETTIDCINPDDHFLDRSWMRFRNAVSKSQEAQDDGMTWGQALAVYKVELDEREPQNG